MHSPVVARVKTISIHALRGEGDGFGGGGGWARVEENARPRRGGAQPG